MNAFVGTRVLIVEDEPIVSMMLEDMIKELGATVAAVAMRVDEGLRRVDEGGFDVAVLDVNLHGDQSYPIADALRAQGVPFLFATGYGTAAHYAEYCDAVTIRKPYALEHIRQSLTKVLNED